MSSLFWAHGLPVDHVERDQMGTVRPREYVQHPSNGDVLYYTGNVSMAMLSPF